MRVRIGLDGVPDKKALAALKGAARFSTGGATKLAWSAKRRRADQILGRTPAGEGRISAPANRLTAQK
jgi:hypothetical protein